MEIMYQRESQKQRTEEPDMLKELMGPHFSKSIENFFFKEMTREKEIEIQYRLKWWHGLREIIQFQLKEQSKWGELSVAVQEYTQ